MMDHFQINALDIAQTMKFFVSVCTDMRYAEGMRPVLERVGKRYTQYANRFAKALNTDTKEINAFCFYDDYSHFKLYGFWRDFFCIPAA